MKNPRYSIKTLLIFTVGLCIFLATILVPRDRFDKSRANELNDGMTIDECSKVLGAAPGWYDGIYVVSGLPIGTKMQNTVDWVNANGAIVADIDHGGTVSNIRVFNAAEFDCSYDLRDLLYDRTLMRLFGSHSTMATFIIILLGISISIGPTLVLARLSGLAATEFISIGSLIAIMIYVAFGIFGGTWWPTHHEQKFVDRQCLMGLGVFVSTSALYGIRIRNRRLKFEPSPDPTG